jgi:FAD synthetase
MLLDATKLTLKFLTDLPAHNAARSEILLISSADEWVERLGVSRSGTVLTIGNFDGVHVGHQKICAMSWSALRPLVVSRAA